MGVAVAGVVAKSSLWSAPIRLTRAELVVLHGSEDVRRVDVTDAVGRLLSDGCYRVTLLSRLLTLPVSEDIVDFLTHCHSQQHSRLRPLCFVDVSYVTPSPWIDQPSLASIGRCTPFPLTVYRQEI